jgi:hypothetical protein
MGYVKEYLRRTTTRYGETFRGVEFEPLRVPVKCGALEWKRILAYFRRREIDARRKG